MTSEQQPVVLRASRPKHFIQPDTYDDLDADVKPHSSALLVNRRTEPVTQPPVAKYRFAGLWRPILKVVIVCLCLFFIGDTAGYAAWTAISQRLQYGTYPTTQMDVNLGHGGVSHLTAYTVGDEVMLTEQVGNKLTPYAIKLKTPLDTPRVVSITIADVNLDGRPDVLLHVDGLNMASIIFDNTGSGLVLSVAG